MNDTCALTLLEKYLTGRNDCDTFIGRIVKPVYNISNNNIVFITLSLLTFSSLKYIYLYCC